MHLALHSAPPAESHAAQLLGPWHPLTRALDRRLSLRCEVVVLGAILVGALAGVAEGARGAIAVVLAAGFAGLPAGFRLLLEVRRECSRLLDLEHRQREAEWFVRVADGRDLGLGVPGRVPPLIDDRVARAALAELLGVAAELRGEQPGVEGVALVEQIACEPWSPLFGQDERALREVLCRARFLLSA